MILEGEFFTSIETTGEHSRGKILSASVVLKISTSTQFIGNYTVHTYYGPYAKEEADAKVAFYRSPS